MKCEKCNNCQKTKHRTEEEKKKISKRLNIIEGQIKGIKQMVEDDRYCNDILIQISAINKSLKSLGNEILKSHLSTCVVNDLKNDNLEVIDEIIDLFGRIN
ncbi:MAG: metal-sensing transcriptional repressor [Candidatus Coprovivens sp.]